MLVHQICTRVQSLVDDPAYWSNAKIIALINNCKDSISTYFGLQANGYILMESVVGQRSYSLPLDFAALNYMTWGDGNQLTPFNRVNSPREASSYLAYTDVPAIPTNYFLWSKEDHIELWVLPTFNSVVEIELFYWRNIPDVANPNDEVMLPRDIHHHIVDYCLRQTWFNDELHNFTPERFDSWWDFVLMSMQISKNVQLAGSDSIGMGNFNDRMPIQNEDSIGFPIRISSGDGTQW